MRIRFRKPHRQNISNTGTPWPQVGRVHGATVGTGFLVGKGRVLTAAHVVEGAPAVKFQLGSTSYSVTKVQPFQELDAAILTLEAPNNEDLPEPLPLCHVPQLPVPYIAWGYWATGGEVPLQGTGRIQARPKPTLLQLNTRSQVPGMSGAPLAIRVRDGGWRIVGLGCARHVPEEFMDDQSLALGCPIEAIPAEILSELGEIVQADACRLNGVPAAEELMRTLEEEAARRDRIATYWRAVSGGATLALLIPAVLGFLNILPPTASSICLVSLITLAWFGHAWARDSSLDAEKSRTLAAAIGFLDVENDRPESLLPFLQSLAHR